MRVETFRKYYLLFGSIILSSIPFIICSAPALDASHKDQGAALFRDKGCAHCHGPSGFGGSDSGPDLSRVRKELRTAEIAQQIHDGGNNMPAFGDSLSSDELEALVAYLHAKRKPPPGWSKKLPTAAPPKAPSGADPD